jgi:hypothetical protein
MVSSISLFGLPSSSYHRCHCHHCWLLQSLCRLFVVVNLCASTYSVGTIFTMEYVFEFRKNYAKALSYSFVHDPFDSKRRCGMFNVFVTNNQLDFVTEELSIVMYALMGENTENKYIHMLSYMNVHVFCAILNIEN